MVAAKNAVSAPTVAISMETQGLAATRNGFIRTRR